MSQLDKLLGGGLFHYHETKLPSGLYVASIKNPYDMAGNSPWTEAWIEPPQHKLYSHWENVSFELDPNSWEPSDNFKTAEIEADLPDDFGDPDAKRRIAADLLDGWKELERRLNETAAAKSWRQNED